LAKDDPSKPDLGRSEQDMKTIQIAWQQFWQLKRQHKGIPHIFHHENAVSLFTS